MLQEQCVATENADSRARKPQILFRSEGIIALNKPAGVPVQQDRSGDKALSETAARLCGKKVYVVHRIDRPVSGAVLFACRKDYAAALSRQFSEGAVEKVYWAVVDAALPAATGTLEHRIISDGRSNRSRAVAPNLSFVTNGTDSLRGDFARLHFRTAGKTDRYWLVELRPETGRHHQIRAQLAAAGCHIKGDLKYGARRSDPGGGIHLHARSLTFADPDGKQHPTVTAPVPPGDPLWRLFEEISGA